MTYLDFAPEHAASYNELAEVIKLNLLLADWNDPDHNESLLSARNSKWGKEMLHNARSAAVPPLPYIFYTESARGLSCLLPDIQST